MTLEADLRIDHYQLTSHLGTGGMGEVHRARDLELGRDVALKILPATMVQDPERLQRFEQEARTLAQLNHPNVVQVYGFGRWESRPYIVMELLSGTTLRDAIAVGPIGPRRSLDLAIQVCAGLCATHEKGIIHRDLKPENIFLAKGQGVRLLDFGLSKPTDPFVPPSETETTANLEQVRILETREGMVMGTVAYISPEQLLGRPVDARSDIFSFGVVLYEMLAGERPFAAPSGIEVMHGILKSDPRDLPFALGIPASLESTVRRCLEKDPEARFQTARDLAFALAQLQGQVWNPSTQIPPPRAPVSRTWKRWALVSGAAAVLLLAGAGIASLLPRKLTLERVTQTPLVVTTARFMPGGRAVIFSAVNAVGEDEVFLQSAEDRMPRPLQVGNARVLAVSPRGEVALDMVRGNRRVLGLLASVGLAPRVLLEDRIDAAAWDAEGRELILKHWRYGGRPTQAFVYRGKPIYQVPLGFGAGSFTLTPDGKGIAFLELRSDGNYLVVAPLNGGSPTARRTMLTGDSHALLGGGLAGWDSEAECLIRIDPDGRHRKVLMPLAGGADVFDSLPDGTLLLSQPFQRIPGSQSHILWKRPGSDRLERVLAMEGAAATLLDDGRSLVFSTYQRRHPFGRETWLLKDGESALTPLAHGHVLETSPDGTQTLVVQSTPSGGRVLRMVPTFGAGPERTIPGEFATVSAFFIPGQRSVLIQGLPADRGAAARQSFILDLDTWNLRLLPFKARGPVSLDGTWAFAHGESGQPNAVRLVNLVTGETKALPEVLQNVQPISWAGPPSEYWGYRSPVKSADGALNYLPGEFVRVDSGTGRISMTIPLPDPGVPKAMIFTPAVQAEGRAYTYRVSLPPFIPVTLYRLKGA